MTMIAIGSTLLGAVLGLRFKVLILLPVSLIGLMSIALTKILHQTSVSGAILAGMLFVCLIQLGYLVGLFARYVLAGSRLRAPTAVRSQAAQN
jgi:hypothetical protein